MDEFAWERLLKESDARTDKLVALYEKYEGIELEVRERLLVREMDWSHIEEYLAAKANREPPTPDVDSPPPRKPDPLTEGVDWIRDEHGHAVHPLYHRMFKIASAMWHDCEKTGLLGGHGSEAVQDMVFSAQMINAKLAGALNGLCFARAVDGGFIVACLKRALHHLHEAMRCVHKVKREGSVGKERLAGFHLDLHSVREEILRLMDTYRA